MWVISSFGVLCAGVVDAEDRVGEDVEIGNCGAVDRPARFGAAIGDLDVEVQALNGIPAGYVDLDCLTRGVGQEDMVSHDDLRADHDRNRGLVRVGLPVVGLVREAVGPVEAGVRRVGERAVRVQSKRSVRHVAEEHRRERTPARVVGQHAPCGVHHQLRVAGRVVCIVVGYRLRRGLDDKKVDIFCHLARSHSHRVSTVGRIGVTPTRG